MKQWVGLGLLGVGAALCAGSLPSPLTGRPAASRELELSPGRLVRHDLKEGESHDYPLPLAPGEVVDVTIEQEGIDVSLILLSPDLEVLLSLDTPMGTHGAERLFAVAETGRPYRLRVQAATGKASGLHGSYTLRLAKPRPAGSVERMRARAWQEYSQGEKLRRAATGEARRTALVHYGIALRLWRTVGGDRAQEAIALYRRATIMWALGDLQEAVETYEQALPLAQDTEIRVSILNLLSMLYKQIGDTRMALRRGEQALELAPQTGNPVLYGAALNNLGSLYRTWGENDKALAYFDAALEKWREVGPCPDLAQTLTNKGEVLLAIGSPQPAIKLLKDALQVQEEIGDRIGAAQTHRTLGSAFGILGQLDLGLREMEQAHAIAKETGNRWIEGLTLNDIGSVQLRRREIVQARAAFTEAYRIAREEGQRDNEAYALSGLGRVLVEQGDGAGALERFARSQELFTQLDDPNALSLVLYGRALAERRLGRLDASRQSIEHALELVESLREEVSQHDLQTSVISVRSDLYDLRVDLLLRLHERRPDQGYDAASFAASENRRARSLLEGVRRMGAGIPPTLSREILDRREVLRSQLQALAQEKLKSGPRKRPGIEAEIRAALARWDDLSEEIRRQSPGYAAVAAPKLVGVPEVQDLLDSETALIAYTVGEERSILWWIEKDALEVHQDLPPRKDLEPLASDVYELISHPSTKQRGLMQDRLARLGEILLGPVAERLPRVRRLVVVADETLQTLPFAALPVPGSDEPLVATHAVVELPSASLAAALRARQESRPTPPELIAAFADPVFGLSDERFSQKRGSTGALPRPSVEMARLPRSLEEADTILGLVSASRSLRLVGFEASRRAALDPKLARDRYIHFATHGLVEPDNPSLSGIQLSRIDPQGRPLEGDGILPFYEVYNLSLPADLVTLSACQTAVGPQVRGEGVLGMSRSFLYAGASRVIGALWEVEDADAADLMILFYQGLLRDGVSPAVALQRAQNTLRTRARRDTPYSWAGFVLQGDWR